MGQTTVCINGHLGAVSGRRWSRLVANGTLIRRY
jgi:hypothetical protein